MSRLIRESDVQDMLDDAQCISDGEYSYVCADDIKLSKLPTVDAVPVSVFDRIIEELELHMYRIEGQDDLLYPLTPRQMTMNSTFEIAIDVVERIRKEQTDAAD